MTWRDLPAQRDQPIWVRAWTKARAANDMRLLPEQEPGYRNIDQDWHTDGGTTPSGYDWNDQLETRGLMPVRDRERYAKPDAPKIPQGDDDIPF